MKKPDAKLVEILKREYEDMKHSKYESDHDYNAQAWRMVTIISGYAPGTTVDYAWNLIREILHETL